MEVNKKEVGNRIKDIRINNGLTMEELADVVESNKSNVSRWERGLNIPNEATLRKIAVLGGVTVEELLENINPLERYSDIELLSELLRRKQNI